MATRRSRDMLESGDYVKLLKANLDGCPLRQHYQYVEPEDLCETFRNFLVDVCDATRRVNLDPLRKAVLRHFSDMTGTDAEAFARSMSKAVQFCVTKSRSASSCKKLTGGVADIVKVLLKGKRQKEIERKSASKPGTSKNRFAGGSVKSASAKKKTPESKAAKTKANNVAKDPLAKKLFESPTPKRSKGSPESYQKRSKQTLTGKKNTEDSQCLSAASSGSRPEPTLPVKKTNSFFDPVLGIDVSVSPSGQLRKSSGSPLPPLCKRPAAKSPDANKELLKKRPAAAMGADRQKGTDKKRSASKDFLQKEQVEGDPNKVSEPLALVPLEEPALEGYEKQPLCKVNVVTTCFSKPVRSYVQAQCSDRKKRLICEFAEKNHPDHADLALQVKQRIENDKLTYTAARALKSAMLDAGKKPRS